jgi:hypothetical protein
VRILSMLVFAGAWSTAVALDEPSTAADRIEIAGDVELDAPARPGPPDLTLRWFDVHGLLPDGFDAVALQVESIFRGIGVEVAWSRGVVGGGFEKNERLEIPVILLRSQPPGLGPRRVMGAVVRGRSHPSPIWIVLDNVRWALGHRGRLPKADANAELAVALGRVVVHEVIHAIAPDHPHEAKGLMHRAIGRSELVGPSEPLNPKCVRSVRDGLQALAVAAALPPATRHAALPRLLIEISH